MFVKEGHVQWFVHEISFPIAIMVKGYVLKMSYH